MNQHQDIRIDIFDIIRDNPGKYDVGELMQKYLTKKSWIIRLMAKEFLWKMIRAGVMNAVNGKLFVCERQILNSITGTAQGPMVAIRTLSNGKENVIVGRRHKHCHSLVTGIDGVHYVERQIRRPFNKYRYVPEEEILTKNN